MFSRGTSSFCLALAVVLAALGSRSLGQNRSLNGVVAISATDAWAVGFAYTGPARIVGAGLAEHWDGTKWTVVSTPNPEGACNTLNAVGAVSSSDVWAVGGFYSNYEFRCGIYGSFPGSIEHWDGVAWSLVPNPSPNGKMFTGVAAIASNDVWSVGYSFPVSDPERISPLAEHWDGSEWKVVPTPRGSSELTASFQAITAASKNDVWAVGSYSVSEFDSKVPFAEHWDGTAWTIVAVPETVQGDSYLVGTGSAGSNEIWATGWPDIFLLWDGSQWISYTMPDYGGGLDAVFVFRDGLGWAVGSQSSGQGIFLTLTYYWDGKAWILVPSPNPDDSQNFLAGDSGTGPDDVWAVGQYGVNARTLVEHWDGQLWSVVPSD
jgi:hypothetical protein